MRGMNTLTLEPLATEVSFDSDNMWVQLSDGRHLGVPLAYFPRLAGASPAQRKKYLISGGGVGLHWDELDETFRFGTSRREYGSDRKAESSR